MKKPFHFTSRSDTIICFKCGHGLKRNILSRKEKMPKLCYKHWQENERAVQQKKDEAYRKRQKR